MMCAITNLLGAFYPARPAATTPAMDCRSLGIAPVAGFIARVQQHLGPGD